MKPNPYILNDDGSVTLTPAINARLWCIAGLVSKAMGYSGHHVGVLETVSAHLLNREG